MVQGLVPGVYYRGVRVDGSQLQDKMVGMGTRVFMTEKYALYDSYNNGF